MKRSIFPAAAGLMLIVSPAWAQNAPASEDPGTPHTPLEQDRGYDKPSPRTDAINAPNQAERVRLNANVAALTEEQREGYRVEDIAAYEAAVRAHDETLMRDEARYRRQQMAYADAMWAWRVQVHDCRRGSRVACEAPAPRPADFY